MPSYYQGPRDEYGNRDYARRDGFADRLYERYDERGRSPEDDLRARTEERVWDERARGDFYEPLPPPRYGRFHPPEPRRGMDRGGAYGRDERSDRGGAHARNEWSDRAYGRDEWSDRGGAWGRDAYGRDDRSDRGDTYGREAHGRDAWARSDEYGPEWRAREAPRGEREWDHQGRPQRFGRDERDFRGGHRPEERGFGPTGGWGEAGWGDGGWGERHASPYPRGDERNAYYHRGGERGGYGRPAYDEHRPYEPPRHRGRH